MIEQDPHTAHLDALFDRVLGTCGRLEDAAHRRLYFRRGVESDDLDRLIMEVVELVAMLADKQALLSLWDGIEGAKPTFYDSTRGLAERS